MHKARLEAFSDGVIAIIITIMALELKTPHGTEWADLGPLIPVLMSYVLSFAFVGIYWNNHHHLLQAAHKVSGPVLWANLHLLFWLSLTPFVTAWMGETWFSAKPVVAYGFVLLFSAIAYYILSLALVAVHGRNSTLGKALGKDFKGKISIVIYLVAMALAFVNTWVAYLLYVLVAVMWLIPDRRIERAMKAGD
jgi:uncharacterized membrane protein